MLVGTIKLEVRVVMVEKFLVEKDDIGIASLVITVTDTTGCIAHMFRAAVVSLPCFDVIVDIVMTVQAERILRFFAEPGMTTGTFMLVFGMSLNDLSRH